MTMNGETLNPTKKKKPNLNPTKQKTPKPLKAPENPSLGCQVACFGRPAVEALRELHCHAETSEGDLHLKRPLNSSNLSIRINTNTYINSSKISTSINTSTIINRNININRNTNNIMMNSPSHSAQ